MPARPALRRTAAAFAAAVALMGVSSAAAAPPPGQAPNADANKDRVTFGLGPGGQSYVDKRASLSYAGAPGSTLVDRIAVYNQSNVALDLLVYGSDGVNGQTGKFDLRPRAEKNTDLGSWLALGQAALDGKPAAEGRSVVRVHVPPQSARTGIGRVLVPMDVIVPATATPGDHTGGIVAALISTGDNPSSQNIELEQRVALKVYFRVSGEVKRGLSVKILKTEYVGGSGLGLSGTLRVSYQVRNTGNVRLGAMTALRAKGPFGIGARHVDGPKVDELVPGGAALLSADIKDVRPTILGWASVEATAVAPPLGEAPHLRRVSDQVRFWAITWQEVVLLLLVLGYLLYRRWRKTQPPRGKHVRAKEPTGSSPAKVAAVGVGVLAVTAALAVGATRHADAADLGPIQVAPLQGTDSTLLDGYLKSARCPRGTVDSYWTVDGPDLPRDQAFLAPGNTTGTGPQQFRGASIANLRTVNAGAFGRSGTYAIRFSCVRSPDGKVTDSYQAQLRYTAGGAGRFRVSGATLVPPAVRDPDYAPTPAATQGSAAPAAATATPLVSRGAGVGAGSLPTSAPDPDATRAAGVPTTGQGGTAVGWWVALGALVPLLLGAAVVLRRSA